MIARDRQMEGFQILYASSNEFNECKKASML